jgi:hypothetical protein
MFKRSFLLFATIILLSFTGCVKETYDMHKLSKEAQLSPTLALSAIDGKIGLSYFDMPVNLSIEKSLRIVDTVDNFLKVENSDNFLKPENFERLSIIIAATNEFPLRVSLQMSLYNSSNHTVDNITTISAIPFLEAAPVAGDGSIIPTETTTRINFSRNFLKATPNSDKLVLMFTFTTPPTSTDFVTIKPEYKIKFKATLVMKPEINL